MRIIDVKQRSEEWLTLRRSHIGASDCAAILEKSQYRSPRMVWREKLFGEKKAITPAMQKGIDLESKVLEMVNAELMKDFCPAVGIGENPWQMASLDGWNGSEILEIKVVGKKTIDKVLEGEIPEDYIWQIHHQMAVFDTAQKAYLAFYSDHIDSCILQEFERDEKKIAHLTEWERNFYFENMLKWIEPSSSDLDVEERMDEEWLKSTQDYIEACKAADEALAKKEAAREALIALTGDHRSYKGGGLMVSKVFSRGSIDYSKVKELEGVDLEPYRKEGRSSWRITATSP